MPVVMLMTCLLLAEPTPEQSALLSQFRAEFIAITPGKEGFPASFTMGREGFPSQQPAHEVTLNYSFAIAKYEVPQNLWKAVLGTDPSKWKGPRNSVEMFTFEEAQKFCQQATEQMRALKLIDDDQLVRLPTEAEWEYCARAGTTTAYSFGDDAGDLGSYGWFTGNAAGNDPPVGAKKPNAWGLYDVHGYLWEWCQDRWHDNYRGAPSDGSAWLDGGDAQRHVARGGSWKDDASKLQSAYRQGWSDNSPDDAVGLRCVLARKGLVRKVLDRKAPGSTSSSR